jgi:hypothetical protein
VAIPTPPQSYGGPYYPRQPTLAEILSNSAPSPWTLSAFMAYLSQNHCLETLEFTMDASRYRKHYNQMTAAAAASTPNEEKVQYVRMLWQRLLEAYITPNGPREVNLPSAVRDTLLSQQNTLLPPSPGTLDPAVKIIYELMDESVLVPFLNSISRPRGHRSSVSMYNTSDENLYTQSSLDERRIHQSRRRDQSPPHPSIDFVSSSYSNNPVGRPSYSNLTQGFARVGSSRLATTVSTCSNASGDALTDDSGSVSSPLQEPMTPPNTPPTTDLSPKASWKKMTGKLGWKKSRNGSQGSYGSSSSGISSQLRDSQTMSLDEDNPL